MPKFSFRCGDCLFTWDGRLPTSEIPSHFECPRCRSNEIEKTLPSSLKRKEVPVKRPGDFLKKRIREMRQELVHDDSASSYDDFD